MHPAELPSPPPSLDSQPSVDETTERHSILSVASASRAASQDGQPSTSTSVVPWKGWVALGVFTLQNSLSALYGQFVLQNRPRCNARVLVLVQELAIKLPMSLLLYAVEQGGVLRMLRSLIAELRERPRVWARMGFPAVCYTVGAILQMVGGANLDASMGQVTFQSKIIFTAACSVALLGTRLSRAQLVAIFILSAGVVLADVGPALLHSGADASHSTPKPTLRPMHPRLGVAAWLGAALCSAFASVYFEKMVKLSPGDEPAPSLWLRNIQLCSLSCLTGVVLVGAEWREGSTLRTHGPLHNFDHFVWLFILLGGSGGIVVALVIKHADNIRRGFAAGLALILTSLGSHFLYGNPSPNPDPNPNPNPNANPNPNPNPNLRTRTRTRTRLHLHSRVRRRHAHGRAVNLPLQRQLEPARLHRRGRPNARLPRMPTAPSRRRRAAALIGAGHDESRADSRDRTRAVPQIAN